MVLAAVQKLQHQVHYVRVILVERNEILVRLLPSRISSMSPRSARIADYLEAVLDSTTEVIGLCTQDGLVDTPCVPLATDGEVRHVWAVEEAG